MKNKAAAKAQANAERSELVVFDDQGADAGALVEAREAQILNFFLHLVGLAIYAIIVLFQSCAVGTGMRGRTARCAMAGFSTT